MATIEATTPSNLKTYYTTRQSNLEIGISNYLIRFVNSSFPIKDKQKALLKECDLSVIVGCFCNLRKTLFISEGDRFEILYSSAVNKFLRENSLPDRVIFQQFVNNLSQGEVGLCKPGSPLWRTSCKEVLRKETLRNHRRRDLLQLIKNQKIDIPNDVILDKSICLNLIKPFYDITLFEWDMHHASMFDGNDEFIFFIVRKRKIYLVQFGNHKNLNDDDFVKIAHDNWPELFPLWSQPTVIDPEWSSEQRKNIRGSGKRYVTANVSIEGLGAINPINSFDVSLSLPLRVRQELDFLLKNVPNNISDLSQVVRVSQTFIRKIEEVILG